MIKKFVRLLALILMSSPILAQNYVWIIGSIVGLAGGDTWKVFIIDATPFSRMMCDSEQLKYPGQCTVSNLYFNHPHYIKWGCISKNTYLTSNQNNTNPTINKVEYTVLKPGSREEALKCK